MSFYNNNNFNSSVPDSELFNRIRASKASITETHAYFQALQDWIKQGNSYSDPQYSTVINHFTWIEMILDGLNEALPNASAIEPAKPDVMPLPEERSLLPIPQLERSYSKQKSSEEQEAEILAAATSKDSEMELTRLAAAQNRPFHIVEGLAKVLLKAQGLDSKYDLSKTNYHRCVEAIREIELKEDPGEKDWKLYDLARKYGRSKDAMLESYYKSLLVHHLEDPVSFKEFIAKNPQLCRWLLRGWIPEKSLVLFYGHGGIGKTLFTHHLIKHIVQGIDWNEYKVDNGGGILYIQTDTALTKAIQALRQAGIPDDVPIQLHGSWRIEFMHYLYKWIQQQRPALVIIDSLTSVNRYATVNENDSKYAQPILQLRDIASEFSCSFVIIHHANGAGEMRGTKAVRAAVDEVWKIEKPSKDETDPKRLLIIEKSRSRATGRYEMQFNDEDFSWDLLEPEDENGNPTQNSSARWSIVNQLNKHKGVRFSNQDLAQILGCSPETIRKEFLNLAREGLIDRDRNPNYASSHAKGEPMYLYYIST